MLEIGAGVGYLAVEMAKHCDTLVAVESDPAFSWAFTKHLYKIKPDNLTWLFGSAEKIHELFPPAVTHCHGTGRQWTDYHFDVAVIFTRSGVEQLEKLGESLTGHKPIMFYQEHEDDI